MSLIDTSYFIGPILVPQLGQPGVGSGLNLFINRSEAPFLQAALGYELWQDFVDGLSQPVIDQKWIDLRDGVAFTATGMWPPFMWKYPWMGWYRNWYVPMNPLRKMFWVGFTGGGSSVGNNIQQSPELVLVTGSGANNPVTGATTFSLSTLAGKQYWIERRNFGTMIEGTDVNITNSGQTWTLLKPGDQFADGEIFIVHFTSMINSGAPSASYQSPLAGYTYYEYSRDQVTQNTGVGIVVTNAENAFSSSAAIKMGDAFNRMSKDIYVLWLFLEAKGTTVYPSYDRLKVDYQFFKPINRYNI